MSHTVQAVQGTGARSYIGDATTHAVYFDNEGIERAMCDAVKPELLLGDGSTRDTVPKCAKCIKLLGKASTSWRQ